jgi:WD40 repeat protein
VNYEESKEIYYLKRPITKKDKLIGHSGSIYSLSIDFQNEYLLSSSHDATI